MKKIFIIFALAFAHFFNVYGQEDKFDKLLEKYQEAEGVTSIKIAKPMFGMLSSLNIEDSQLDQIKPLLAKIKGLRVLITENSGNTGSKDGKKIQANLSELNRDISSYLKTLNYSEIMTMNSSGSKIKFLSSEAKDGVLDDLLLSIDSGSGESILVKLDGKLSMDDVNKLINSSETKFNPATNTRTNLTSENNSSYLSGESRNVGDFSAIQVSTGVNVVFKQESPTSVKVIADADKLQYIMTKVENGMLKVYIDNKGQKNLKFKNISVNVSSPRLSEIRTSSGGTFTGVNTIRENNLILDTSSGSVVKGDFEVSNTTNVETSSGSNVKAMIKTKMINVKSSSGSDAVLEGLANSGVIDISSGAVCKAENFVLKTLDAEATSGGAISVTVSDKLNVKASSGGSIKYKGNPQIDSKISKTSGGSLKPIN